MDLEKKVEEVLSSFSMYNWDRVKVDGEVITFPKEVYNHKLEESLNGEDGDMIGKRIMEEMTTLEEFSKVVKRSVSNITTDISVSINYKKLLEKWVASKMREYLYSVMPDIYKKYGHAILKELLK
jgi:hypothetical protein